MEGDAASEAAFSDAVRALSPEDQPLLLMESSGDLYGFDPAVRVLETTWTTLASVSPDVVADADVSDVRVMVSDQLDENAGGRAALERGVWEGVSFVSAAERDELEISVGPSHIALPALWADAVGDYPVPRDAQVVVVYPDDDVFAVDHSIINAVSDGSLLFSEASVDQLVNSDDVGAQIFSVIKVNEARQATLTSLRSVERSLWSATAVLGLAAAILLLVGCAVWSSMTADVRHARRVLGYMPWSELITGSVLFSVAAGVGGAASLSLASSGSTAVWMGIALSAALSFVMVGASLQRNSGMAEVSSQ